MIVNNFWFITESKKCVNYGLESVIKIEESDDDAQEDRNGNFF